MSETGSPIAAGDGDPRLFLVSCPRVIHSTGKPITYLFVVNASCPPEARRHENWGLVERGTVTETEIVRGGLDVARKDLESRTPAREWRISVGNENGLLLEERCLETEGRDEHLKDVVKRIPASALLLPEALVPSFIHACREAGVTYRLHHNPFPLCADCVEFGCESCDKKSRAGREALEGTKIYLV